MTYQGFVARYLGWTLDLAMLDEPNDTLFWVFVEAAERDRHPLRFAHPATVHMRCDAFAGWGPA